MPKLSRHNNTLPNSETEITLKQQTPFALSLSLDYSAHPHLTQIKSSPSLAITKALPSWPSPGTLQTAEQGLHLHLLMFSWCRDVFVAFNALFKTDSSLKFTPKSGLISDGVMTSIELRTHCVIGILGDIIWKNSNYTSFSRSPNEEIKASNIYIVMSSGSNFRIPVHLFAYCLLPLKNDSLITIHSNHMLISGRVFWSLIKASVTSPRARSCKLQSFTLTADSSHHNT